MSERRTIEILGSALQWAVEEAGAVMKLIERLRSGRAMKITLLAVIGLGAAACNGMDSRQTPPSRSERIERAASLLGGIPVQGYCREVPRLEDVVSEASCCTFSRKHETSAGTTYISDDQGPIVTIGYSCTGSDGATYLAAQAVDLDTQQIQPIYSDPNARHLRDQVGAQDAFPEQNR